MGKNVIKKSINKSQNLREFLQQVPIEFKYNSIGISEEIFNYTTKEDSEENVVISLAVESKDGARDRSIIKPYIENFMAHKFTAKPYFTENDGEVYWLVKDFFESNFPSKEADNKLLLLCRFFNVLNRQVNNDLYAKYDTLWDKFCAPDIRKAYNTGKTIVIKPNNGLFKKNWNRNPLKEAAWVVVHSYLIDKFMSENYQYRLIPKKPELAIMWNHYIELMSDVPDLVKKYYLLNENGKSAFMYHYETVMNISDDKADTEESVKGESIETEHPVDDHEEGAVPFEDAIVIDTTNIASSSEDIKSSFKNAIDKDDEKIIDGKFNVVVTEEQPEVVKKVKQEKKQEVKKEDKKPVSRPEEHNKEIYQNNTDTEAFYPKLNKFTDLCRKNNYSVYYGNNSSFPGLIQAVLIDRKDVTPKRSILIDPCIIYGDTLRIISMISAEQDIRKESFVAISQHEAVEKIINGTFNKDDRRMNNEQLPRCLNDYRNAYIFIDRIDLRNLQEITKKEDGRSISFNEWKKLIINISNIFRNSDIPICRFRVCEYSNCNKFKLICDNNVMISYATNLVNEESQKLAMVQNFWVDYDSEKYEDANYVFGIINVA